MKLLLTPFPTLLFYTDNLPDGTGGCANGPVVRIRPKYRERNDTGIHAHEYLHVSQFWRPVVAAVLVCALMWWVGIAEPLAYVAVMFAGLVAHGALYGLVKHYKLWCEVHAYRVQASHYPAGTEVRWMAFAIANKYGLGITVAEADRELWGVNTLPF